MSDDTPFEVTNCDGKVLGRATEAGAKWAKAKGATIRDTRKPAYESGTLPGGIEWTEDPEYRLNEGDIIIRPSEKPLAKHTWADNDNWLTTLAADPIWICVVPAGHAGKTVKEANVYGEFKQRVLKTGRPTDDLPYWVVRDRVYEFNGERYKPSAYRFPRWGEVWVAFSSNKRRSQMQATKGFVVDGLPRIILERVEDDLPEWVHRQQVYVYEGKEYVAHQYRRPHPVDDVWVSFSGPLDRKQSPDLAGKGVTAYGGPRIILRRVDA